MNFQKEFDLIIFIGRTRPLHNSHVKVFQYASTLTDNFLNLVGSSHKPRDPKNPFNFEECKFMNQTTIEKEVPGFKRTFFAPLRDYPGRDNKWLRDVQINIDYYTNILKKELKLDRELKIGIIGHKKDSSSYYLDMFPHLELIEVENFGYVNSTDIRKEYFEGKDVYQIKDIPSTVQDFLFFFKNNFKKEYQKLVNEYDFYKEDEKKWSKAPHYVNFVTTDVVYVCSGHVLMIKRKINPGKDLYALPGGFLKKDMTLIDSAITKLREETKIKFSEKPEKFIKNKLKKMVSDQYVFDAPNRSLRGRIITHAYYIENNQRNFPIVKGSDDAEFSQWVPIHRLKEMEEKIFEDHLAIIEHFIYKNKEIY